MFLVANPIMRWLTATGFGKRFPDLGRMDFVGHKTGKKYSVVVALHDVDGRQAALTNSGWRHNFADGHPVILTVAGQRYERLGRLLADPDGVAEVYARRIEAIGADKAPRRLGIKIPEGTKPTHEELAAFARREGLSVIYLDPTD
jgi:hypothetical protein